jgi:hypothetical protein
MTQSLISLNGGTNQIQSASDPVQGTLYSPQYIKLNSLNSRPTEWVAEGRPIYHRLPNPNEIFEGEKNRGYVYIPYGQGIFGPVSLEVEASTNNQELIIKGGIITWQYGRSVVLPVLLNLQDLQISSARYFVGYELIYDKEPQPFQYKAQDYSLSGLPLTLTSSTDGIIGWRYGVGNAFVSSSAYYWNNQDPLLPSYAQPTQSYIAWESSLPQAFTSIQVQLPATTYVPEGVQAVLYYLSGNTWMPIASAPATLIDQVNFFNITISEAQFQKNWKIEWRDSSGNFYLPIAVESISVDGVVTLEKVPAAAVPRASLVIYPENTAPKDKIYCQLALVDIDNAFQITKIIDLRDIVHQDYVPVSDWLTKAWDDNLIDLYEQVKNYDQEWLSPLTSMEQEYIDLEKSGILVEK